ncbi:MAG: hypothetical protein ACR2GA_00395 [Chloroflexota bacterium]
MAVQPHRGHVQGVRFDAATMFQTNSGPGTLEGLVSGDFVCVAGMQHSQAFTAGIVLFDPRPFPCSPHLPKHPPKP